MTILHAQLRQSFFGKFRSPASSEEIQLRQEIPATVSTRVKRCDYSKEALSNKNFRVFADCFYAEPATSSSTPTCCPESPGIRSRLLGL